MKEAVHKLKFQLYINIHIYSNNFKALLNKNQNIKHELDKQGNNLELNLNKIIRKKYYI